MTNPSSPLASDAPARKQSFLQRLVSGVSTLLDPKREERIAAQSESLYHEFARQREHFNFKGTATHLGIDPSDADAVSERTYQKILTGAWKDGVLSAKEKRALSWA